MTKTDLIFPTFSLRFVDFVVLFCFRCRFLFHEQPFWVKFDKGVIFLDQSKFLAMHSNQWDCLILYRQQITLNGFFRVRQSCQMPAFEYYYYYYYYYFDYLSLTYSQTKWRVPLKITLMNWLLQNLTHLSRISLMSLMFKKISLILSFEMINGFNIKIINLIM